MKTIKIKESNFQLEKFYNYMVKNSTRFIDAPEDQLVMCVDKLDDTIDTEVCEGYKYQDFKELLEEGFHSLVFVLGCVDENNIIELISGDKHQISYKTHTLGEIDEEIIPGISEGDLNLGIEHGALCIMIEYKKNSFYISTAELQPANICSPATVDITQNCGDLDKYIKELLNNFVEGKNLENVIEEDRQIRINKGIGFVFEKSKLLALCPIGATISNEYSLDVDSEVDFLRGGVHFAFPSDVVGMAYENIEGIQSYLGKPNEEIAIVLNVLDHDTNEIIEDINDEFNQSYNVLDKYIEKGYDIKPIGYVYENIEKYSLNEERIEALNLLKINSDEFNLEKLIDTVTVNMKDEIEEYETIKNLRKSRVVDFIFVCSDCDDVDTKETVDRLIENNEKIYIPFAKISVCNMEIEDVISCANGEFIEIEEDIDEVDMGSLNLNDIFDIGILVESNNNTLTFKIVNYISETPAGQSLVQIIEETGIFKDIITEFINGFVQV